MQNPLLLNNKCIQCVTRIHSNCNNHNANIVLLLVLYAMNKYLIQWNTFSIFILQITYRRELRPTSGWDRSGTLGHPCKFQRVRVLAALLHGTLVVGVSQILRRWTEGATYIRQGGHHVGHWPTFLVTDLLIWLPARQTSGTALHSLGFVFAIQGRHIGQDKICCQM